MSGVPWAKVITEEFERTYTIFYNFANLLSFDIMENNDASTK